MVLVYIYTVEVWRKVKKLKNNCRIPNNTVIKQNNKLYTDSISKSELFADYYQNQLNKKDDDININNRILTIQNYIVNNNEQEYNKPIQMHEIETSAKKLKPTSPGIDEVDNRIIKNLPANYYNYIKQLFNKSWFNESLALSWKIALMIPIIKPDKDPMILKSYRPVSMLSCLGKLMERIIYERLNWYIEKNSILLQEQAGFRKKRSAADLITCLENEIKFAFDKRITCVTAFLDLAGAFDKVSHSAILIKLGRRGIEGRMLGWIQDYLTDRKFKIIHEGHESSTRNITSGVPQGGILSPLLFNILLHDLPTTQNVKMLIYADDITLCSTDVDVKKAFINIQTQVDKLHVWAHEWGQEFNIDKAVKIMFFNKNITFKEDDV